MLLLLLQPEEALNLFGRRNPPIRHRPPEFSLINSLNYTRINFEEKHLWHSLSVLRPLMIGRDRPRQPTIPNYCRHGEERIPIRGKSHALNIPGNLILILNGEK